MLNKKYDKPFQWKNRLEGLDSLTGEALPDKKFMWEKLHSRLQQKPRNSKAIWYWAAAGMLPLFLIPILITNRTTDVLVRHLPKPKQNINNPAPALLLATNEPVTVLKARYIEKKQVVTGIQKNEKWITLKDTLKTTDAGITVVLITDETKPVLTANSGLLIDSAFSTSATIPGKKKLPVVHINELETFPIQFTERVNFAQNLSGIRPKKHKTNNQSIATQQNTPGFKIKLSFKN